MQSVTSNQQQRHTGQCEYVIWECNIWRATPEDSDSDDDGDDDKVSYDDDDDGYINGDIMYDPSKDTMSGEDEEEENFYVNWE